MISNHATTPLGIIGSFGAIKLAAAGGVLLLAAVVAFNEANFRFDDDTYNGPDLQTTAKIAVCMACGLYGVALLRLPRSARIGNAPTWMVLLVGWMFVSVTKAIEPVYSLATCATLASLVLFAPAALTQLGRRRCLLAFLATLVAFLAACWGVHVVAPGLNGFDPETSVVADAARLAGLAHPNGTARLAGLALVMTYVCQRRRWVSPRLATLLIVFLWITLIWTGSRTWMATSLATTSCCVWSAIGIKQRVLAVSMAAIAATVALGYAANKLDANTVDKALASTTRRGTSEEIYSMTGRTDLWLFCFEKIRDSPVFGFGYGCQRFVIADDHYWKTQHAHNVLINLSLGGGLVAAGLFLATYFTQAASLLAKPDLFPGLMLVLITIGGFSENPLFNPIPGAVMLAFLLSLFWAEAPDAPGQQAAS